MPFLAGGHGALLAFAFVKPGGTCGGIWTGPSFPLV